MLWLVVGCEVCFDVVVGIEVGLYVVDELFVYELGFVEV